MALDNLLKQDYTEAVNVTAQEAQNIGDALKSKSERTKTLQKSVDTHLDTTEKNNISAASKSYLKGKYGTSEALQSAYDTNNKDLFAQLALLSLMKGEKGYKESADTIFATLMTSLYKAEAKTSSVTEVSKATEVPTSITKIDNKDVTKGTTIPNETASVGNPATSVAITERYTTSENPPATYIVTADKKTYKEATDATTNAKVYTEVSREKVTTTETIDPKNQVDRATFDAITNLTVPVGLTYNTLQSELNKINDAKTKFPIGSKFFANMGYIEYAIPNTNQKVLLVNDTNSNTRGTRTEVDTQGNSFAILNLAKIKDQSELNRAYLNETAHSKLTTVKDAGAQEVIAECSLMNQTGADLKATIDEGLTRAKDKTGENNANTPGYATLNAAYISAYNAVYPNYQLTETNTTIQQNLNYTDIAAKFKEQAKVKYISQDQVANIPAQAEKKDASGRIEEKTNTDFLGMNQDTMMENIQAVAATPKGKDALKLIIEDHAGPAMQEVMKSEFINALMGKKGENFRTNTEIFNKLNTALASIKGNDDQISMDKYNANKDQADVQLLRGSIKTICSLRQSFHTGIDAALTTTGICDDSATCDALNAFKTSMTPSETELNWMTQVREPTDQNIIDFLNVSKDGFDKEFAEAKKSPKQIPNTIAVTGRETARAFGVDNVYNLESDRNTLQESKARESIKNLNTLTTLDQKHEALQNILNTAELKEIDGESYLVLPSTKSDITAYPNLFKQQYTINRYNNAVIPLEDLINSVSNKKDAPYVTLATRKDFDDKNPDKQLNQLKYLAEMDVSDDLSTSSQQYLNTTLGELAKDRKIKFQTADSYGQGLVTSGKSTTEASTKVAQLSKNPIKFEHGSYDLSPLKSKTDTDIIAVETKPNDGITFMSVRDFKTLASEFQDNKPLRKTETSPLAYDGREALKDVGKKFFKENGIDSSTFPKLEMQGYTINENETNFSFKDTVSGKVFSLQSNNESITSTTFTDTDEQKIKITKAPNITNEQFLTNVVNIQKSIKDTKDIAFSDPTTFTIENQELTQKKLEKSMNTVPTTS